jgi:hypothetical protein
MASPNHPVSVQDALYGRISFDAPFSLLLSAPIVQRMRHIRLSNIDSIDLPGIANLSRYEHVLGVAHLASIAGFRPSLTVSERLVLDAAAVLHDWAITSFGHLVEEAFNYVGAKFEHEKQLAALAAGESAEEIGGVEHRQILGGREIGLYPWIGKIVSAPFEQERMLTAITDHIKGDGKYGRVIAGTIDLDNIDNVTRMAYHMGIVHDGELAVQLARAIVGVDEQTRAPIFAPEAVASIEAWLALRHAVYTLLMLSEGDFAGKLMLIAATVAAYEGGQIRSADWSMTDGQFFESLRTSPIAFVKETATRWFVGELWDMAPLSWFEGQRPDYTVLRQFSQALSAHMDRPFFAYGIKDKRDRRLEVMIAGQGPRCFGTNSNQWLLGFGSPKKLAISRRDLERSWSLAESFFGVRRLGTATERFTASEPAWLI